MASIPNYPANNERAKSEKRESEETKEREPVEKIVEGGATKRRKPLGKRFTETFVAEEAGTVVGYLTHDVLVPGIKNVVFDMIRDGFERLLWGEASQRSARRRTPGYTSYNSMYRGERRDRPTDRERDYHGESREDISRRARATHDFEEILITERGEAEEVIDRLSNLVDDYGLATVTDLYDLVGLTSNYTDQRWGWTDLSTASVRSVRGGYLLDLPRPKQVS